jgi:hypothetical protein
MELTESIRTAWTAVEESGIPEHMQELAFKESLRSLLGTAPQVARGQQSKLVRSDEVGGGGDPAGDGNGEGAAPTVDEHAVIAAVSEHTGVAVEKLERVFHLDSGVVKILVNHTALGSNAADKTRAAAQIITVVRKVGMGHADTDLDIIREECQRKHFYDSKNFASKHLPSIDGFAVKGEGRSKRLEARNGGLTAFPGLVDRVLGES